MKKEEGNKNYNYICKCIECGEEKSISKYNLLRNTYALCKKCGVKSVLEANISEILKYWNKDLNNITNMQEMYDNPSAIYWFTCSKGHNFRKTIRDFSPDQCPTCKKISEPSIKTIKHSSGRTFAKCYPHLLEYWNYRKNKEKPTEAIIEGNKKRYWFSCSEGHSYQRSIKEVKEGKCCPFCSDNFAEDRMIIISKELMEAMYEDVSIAPEGNIILIEDIHVALAIYGEHHFKFNRSYHQKESNFTDQLMLDLRIKRNYTRLGYDFRVVEATKNLKNDIDNLKRTMLE